MSSPVAVSTAEQTGHAQEHSHSTDEIVETSAYVGIASDQVSQRDSAQIGTDLVTHQAAIPNPAAFEDTSALLQSSSEEQLIRSKHDAPASESETASAVAEFEEYDQFEAIGEDDRQQHKSGAAGSPQSHPNDSDDADRLSVDADDREFDFDEEPAVEDPTNASERQSPEHPPDWVASTMLSQPKHEKHACIKVRQPLRG
jgi:hypothetical protein